MALITVDFARAFKLRIEGVAEPLQFSAGPQRIDDSLLSHWYVKANLVGADRLRPLPGTREFAMEDQNHADELAHLLAVANTTANKLRELREKNQTDGMRELVQQMGRARPVNEVIADAQRHQEQQRAAGDVGEAGEGTGDTGRDVSTGSTSDASAKVGRGRARATS
jgi:hypothetical protein